MRTPLDFERTLAIATAIVLINTAIAFVISRGDSGKLNLQGTSFHAIGVIPNKITDPNTGESKTAFLPVYLPDNVQAEVSAK